MMRHRLLVRTAPFAGLLLAALAYTGLAGAGRAAAPQEVSAAAPAPQLSIAAPAYRQGEVGTGKRILSLRASRPHFYVVLHNPTDHPLVLWAEENSWGFHNLTLEVVAVDGKALPQPLTVERTQTVVWLSNAPGTETIAPGDSLVREVVLRLSRPEHYPTTKHPALLPLGDPHEYLSFPRSSSGGDHHTIRMRAVLTIPADNWAEHRKVWSGRTESETRDYAVIMSAP